MVDVAPAGAGEPIGFATPDISEDDIRAVAGVLRSGWITSGDECARLEAELGAYLGSPHVVTLASCTAAIETAFAYLNLPAGARVGVPTWTFVASALAPMRSGATPVFLDIDPWTLNLSDTATEAALAAGLDAVVAVHFGGDPVDAGIHELCRAAGVPVIEDAAHAFGARDHRGPVAGQGSVGAGFSFYATKNLTSGEGGALATDDAALADFARSYRLHGLSRDARARSAPGADAGYDLMAAGIKANLSDILAALARSQLTRFAASQAQRRVLVDRYRANLGDVAGLRCVPAQASEGSADHLMVVLLPAATDRRAVVAKLAGRGIATSVHFQPLHRFAWFRARCTVGPGGTAVADALAPRALSLPLHAGLSVGEVDRVCDALTDGLRP